MANFIKFLTFKRTHSPKQKDVKAKFSFKSFCEADSCEIEFENFKPNSKDNKPSKKDDFVVISLTSYPNINIDNIIQALSSPFWHPSCSRKKSLRKPSSAFSIEEFWKSFLSASAALGTLCLNADIITYSDVRDQEPYLYLGLPSITLIDMIHRSIDEDAEPIIFPDGTYLTSTLCPLNSPVSHKLMTHLKNQVEGLNLISQEIVLIKMKLLYLFGETQVIPHELEENLTSSRNLAINALVSDISAVAIELSQMHYFKSFFQTYVNDKVLNHFLKK